MLNFIVLGYIPGTSYQITFLGYLMSVSFVVGSAAVVWYKYYYEVRRKAVKVAAINLIAL